MRAARILVLLAMVSLVPSSWANTVTTIDFEGLIEGTAVTNQFSGLTFSNSTVLTAGSSLNEIDYPPKSGTNVIYDDGGPITISFSTPVLEVGAYLNYTQAITLQAFDAANNLLGSDSTLYSTNLVSTGDPGSSPNEFLQLNFAGGISMVTFTGDPAGGTFTLDDLTITAAQTNQIPEPSTLALMLGAIASIEKLRRRRSV
jgi:hypothetical protein